MSFDPKEKSHAVRVGLDDYSKKSESI